MRTVLAVECGERKTVPVAGVVIFVENDLKNLGCSCYQFKICCRFSKLVYFMLFYGGSELTVFTNLKSLTTHTPLPASHPTN